MSRFLDIIIPHYNEPDEMVRDVISSIARQNNVDFDEIGVIFVDNASTIPTDKEMFKEWPNLNVKLVRLDDNEGPGGACQAGLEASEADFVSFVDCDDELYGSVGVSKIIQFLKSNIDENVITSKCLEQVFDDKGNEHQFVHDDASLCSLHGLFFRKQFLVDNDIKFLKEFRHFNDTYFMGVIYSVADHLYRLDEITYYWKFNEASVVRQKRKHSVTVEFFDEYQLIFKCVNKYLTDRGLPLKNDSIIKSIYGEALFLASDYFDDIPDLKEKYLCNTREMYEMYHTAWLNTDKETIKHYENQELKALNRSYPSLKHIDLEEVLYGIEKEKKHFLDIIIPQSDETEEDIKTLLNSLNIQKNVDFSEIGIIIVNNHSKCQIRKGMLRNYHKLQTTYYRTDSITTIGEAIQHGIDNSNAEYVTFMYCKDSIYDKIFLSKAIEYIKRHHLYSLFTPTVEIIGSGSKTDKLKHSIADYMSLRGLVVSRELLAENNIRFSTDLNYFEDIEFIHKLLSIVQYEDTDAPFVSWYKDKKDATKCYYVEYIDDYIKMRDRLNELIMKVNGPVAQYAVIGIFSACVFINSKYFKESKNYSSKEKYINDLKNMYLKYSEYIKQLHKEMVDSIYYNQLEILRKEYPSFEYVDVNKMLDI